VIPGLVDAHALSLLTPKQRAEFRREQVLLDCLEIAMRSMAFAALPTTRYDLRLIRQKLEAAKIEVKA